jgi:hypothetical protein
MPIRQVETLELSEILGSLLGAIVSAQEQSARATVDFIDAVGLVTTQEDGRDVTSLRTVTMRYRKRDADGEFAEFEVEVPLLTLVNPPTLSIAESSLKFGYEVLATERPSTSAEAGRAANSLAVDRPVKLQGILRGPPRPGTDVRTSFTVDVDIRIRQEPMPVGVQRLFNLAELGIREQQRIAPPAVSPPA